MIAYFKNGKVYNPVAVSTVPGKKVICFITKVNLYVLIGLLFAMTCGCQSGPRSQQVKQSQSLGKAIDPIRLMSELRIQMDEALAEVIAFSTDIAATHQRTGSGLALGDKNHCVFMSICRSLIMILAIA